MATKLEGGGGKALLAGPLKKEIHFMKTLLQSKVQKSIEKGLHLLDKVEFLKIKFLLFTNTVHIGVRI